MSGKTSIYTHEPFVEAKDDILQPGVPVQVTKKQPTSYQVFEKFIHFDRANSYADVSRIFTRECYVEWISTRSASKLKHPAQSFQRVLSAHIRGSDGRRPFPPPVERQLLKTLRDKKNNPWTEMFQSEKINLGRRGFKSKGFHEASGKAQDKDHEEEIQDHKKLELSSFSSGSRLKHHPGLEAHAVPFGVNPNIKYDILEFPSKANVPWDVLISSLCAYIPLKHRQAQYRSAIERDFNPWPAAIYFFLNELVDSTDFRFSRSFLYPSLDERHFRENELVATYVIGNETGIITHQDENAVVLFKGSILDKHSSQLFCSLVSAYYSLIFSLPDYHKDGVDWRRQVMWRNDGTRMVCLLKMTLQGSSAMIEVQDQTGQFCGLQNSVAFI